MLDFFSSKIVSQANYNYADDKKAISCNKGIFSYYQNEQQILCD